MSTSVRIEVVTPTQTVAETKTSEVIASGADGEFGVLPGHALFVSQLRPGLVRFWEEGSDEEVRFVVGRGFAEVGPDHVTIISDTAERVSSLNEGSIRKELESDEARLRLLPAADPEFAVLQDRVERNRARLAALSFR